MAKEKKQEKRVLIEDYVHLKRNGFPCQISYKYKLVKREFDGGEAAPFKWVKERNNTYVIIEN